MIDWVDGQPYSPQFGDVYFSRASGIEEARHVFLEGNRIVERFAALAPDGVFAIGETGFGTGLNFLCAWRAFRETAPTGARLHYVSTELLPLSAADLGRALSLWPELQPLATRLLEQWDDQPRGWQRFVFDGGCVALTLLVGDARETLPQLDGVIDAWFLDGFAPSRNPELWAPELMQAVSAHSRAGTTCATYSSAGNVRRALQAAGFRIEKTPGFGPKREMLRGVCEAPAPVPYRAPWLERSLTESLRREAIVIGAGLAGTAAAASLAARGIDVVLIERHETIAQEASGNAQGVLYAKFSPHDTALTRLLVAGMQFSLREIAHRLPEDGSTWSRCGVLQLAHDAAEVHRQSGLARQAWPATFLRSVERTEAAALAGVAVETGGLFLERAGWVHPPALCTAFTRHPRIRVLASSEALQIDRLPAGRWRVSGVGGWQEEAALVVVAAAADARAFAAVAHLPTHVIRGQLTHLSRNDASGRLKTVLCGEGYIAPARDGVHCLGATFGIRDAGVDLRADDHRENLATLRSLSPVLADAFPEAADDPGRCAGRAALRCMSPDYLPIVGPVTDASAFSTRYARLSKDATTRFEGSAPWLEGLFVSVAHGSRGLLTAPIAGELIAAQALGEPLPVPESVADALSPSRFLARGLKRAADRG
ncbi:MAG: bifunctional tRNA (5-methylaminomethyl-2-thiouridine)(34)-methyltransferase MnmD/FAD-dependent 5-carboxymethylaminomethyl-2-thiouridine(34) oxidoreductase MnmC [Burkholderiales bacterium]|nr:bifunctional tRNA (5-methylaminomethyl-2-thiouridine)(34)-methyltransferase MnmD/FAD-dependent 5-carboxymethylaminomethyl-2-thiouridine(34) oxidoreductase MnmC [Burkholderiales bacterium]